MPLETSFNSIADLNVNWPTGPDLVNKGDDHIRGVKQALKNTFPQIDKPLTITADSLNAVAASVDATGAQITMKKPVDMGNRRVMSVAAPTSDADAANKKFVTDADATVLAAAKAYALDEANQAVASAATDAATKITEHKAAADQHPISGVTGLTVALTTIGEKIDHNTELRDQVDTIDQTTHMVNWKSNGLWTAPSNTSAVAAMWRSADKATMAQMTLVNAAAGQWAGNLRFHHGDPDRNRAECGAVFGTDNKFERFQVTLMQDGVGRDWQFHKSGTFISPSDVVANGLTKSGVNEFGPQFSSEIPTIANRKATFSCVHIPEQYVSHRVLVQNATDLAFLDIKTNNQVDHNVRGAVQFGASDRKLKHDIEDATGGYDRIMKIRSRDFTWNYNNRADRGYIAQELQEIDPRYVFESGDPENPILNVSQTALISDLIATVQQLRHEIAQLRADAGL